MIQHYLKVSVRDLMRYKTQNLIALCGVALSLLCFSICLYCSRYLFGTDDCFQHKDRIVQLIVTDGKSPMSGTPPYLTEYLPAQGVRAAGFCAVAYPQERCYHVTINEEKVLPYDFTVLETDSAYRTVFTPRVLFGSWEQAVQTPNAVILSESKARQIFGSPEQAIGKPMVSAQRLWYRLYDPGRHRRLALEYEPELPGKNRRAGDERQRRTLPKPTGEYDRG